MLSRELRFTGFSADSWLRLLSLFGADGQPEQLQADAPHALTKRGTVVVIEDDDGSVCGSFHTERGSFAAEGYASRADLPGLCERHAATRGVVVRRGAIEDITERAAPRVMSDRDFGAQWLALLAAAREVEREGKLYFWPARASVPLPNPTVVSRALDMVLPNEHCFVAVIWEGDEIWTALLLHRKRGEIDLVAGPELVLDVTGPLGGDYRRDHRALCRAVSQGIAPVHIGLFAQRKQLTELLADPRPGAWAKAVALRDVIIDPAPRYVTVAVGADALRASARKTSEWLGGLDLGSTFEPLARLLREQIAHVSSVTGLLGWNPLQVLAERLRKRDSR